MSTAWLVIGTVAAVALGYGVLNVALGHEGRQLVDRYARAPRTTTVSDEDRIYVRRSRRGRWGRARPVAYERPLDVTELPGDLPDGGILLPPREIQGRNGEV